VGSITKEPIKGRDALGWMTFFE